LTEGTAIGGLIDVNTRFGRDMRRGVVTSPEGIKRAGQRWGVTGAYTCSYRAIQFDWEAGNQETIELCASDSYFRPVAVACVTGVYSPQRVERLRGLGFAMVRLFPEVHGYAVDSAACARLVEALVEMGMPVMLPTVDSEPTRISHLLRGREGTFILCRNRYHVLGELLALAESLPSVCVETSDLVTPDGISAVAKAFSPSRLLWGSGYPMLNVGTPAMVLRGSGLGAEEMAMVASGNARRLLEAGR
jgi:predicted TIM-barrel fold metal-dependent hydrolase